MNGFKLLAWGVTTVNCTLKKRPDGSEYLDCDDGIEREAEPQNQPLNPARLKELWNQHAVASGESSNMEWMIEASENEIRQFLYPNGKYRYAKCDELEKSPDTYLAPDQFHTEKELSSRPTTSSLEEQSKLHS